MNYNIKIDLMRLFGAKLTEDPTAGAGVFIPIGGPLDDQGALSLTAFELKESYDGQSHFIKPWLPKSQLFGMSTEALRQIPYIGHCRPWDRSGNTPGSGCKSCRWARMGKYTTGASYTRCDHPGADWNTTRDIRQASCCPDKNNQNK